MKVETLSRLCTGQTTAS